MFKNDISNHILTSSKAEVHVWGCHIYVIHIPSLFSDVLSYLIGSYTVPVQESENQTPAAAASAKPVAFITDDQLRNLAGQINRKNKGWRPLALQLKVQYPDISKIGKNYKKEDEQVYEMLKLWRGTNSTITIKDLQEIIDKL